MRKLNRINPDNEPTELELSYPVYPEEYAAEGYYGAVNEEGDEKLLLRNIFLTIRKHWLMILSLNLLITALAIVYVAQAPNYYSATARVQVNTEINPALSGENGKGAVIVNSPGADPGYFATQLQILDGTGMARRVIKTLDLKNNLSFLNPQHNNKLTVWQNVQKMFGVYEPPVQKLDENSTKSNKNTLSLKEDIPTDPNAEAEQLAPYVGFLKSGLDVSPVTDKRTSVKETRLIDIEYTHQNPVIAAKIANAIGDVYVLQNLEQKVQSNASAGDFLQKRVAELQSEIRQGNERLMNYARSNQIVSLDPAQNTVVQRLSTLNAELGQAQNARIAAQTAYQAAVQNQMWNTTTESKDPQVTALETKLNDLQQKLAQLKTVYTDKWDEVIQTKQQIESIKSQLLPLRKRATDTQLATFKEKLSESVARENILRNEFEKQQSYVINQNEASINYKIIQQEIDTNKNLLDGLLQQSKQNEVVMSGTRNNVLVLDRALTPVYPSGPERTRTILAAFLASLGLGIGLAFAIDWLDDSVKYSDNTEQLLGLPLLAAIPATPLSLGKKLMPKSLALRSSRRKAKRYYDLEAFEEPLFLESYLQLSTYLMLSTAGRPPKTILITSAEEGEGKTVTALNLASSLAGTKDKVLFIDADLRCPRIHQIKDLPNNEGLTDLLTTENLSDEIIENTIQKIAGENLYFLTAGKHTANPANLLSSKEMGQLLKKLSASYSHIIIDSPPSLYFADSVIISTLVDSVVIVVRDNKSSRKSVLKTKKTFQNVGANIAGMVLNGVHLTQSNYYDYGNYELIQEIETNNGSEVLKIT
jgi:capsular exopolysaccharide synthesis family protein